MIKLIILDLDGVLVDTRDMHYEALNRALREYGNGETYVIPYDIHIARYDGLNTTKKLKMLTDEFGLPTSAHKEVWTLKQKYTANIIRDTWKPDLEKIKILSSLKNDGYIIAVATNSIRDTTKMMLLKRGFMEYIDFFVSNQDVYNPKPSSEVYLRCMIKANIPPTETLIVEDSHIGRAAAMRSGAHVHGVKNYENFIYSPLKNKIDLLNNNKLSHKTKWLGGSMKVLIPMAGAGSRFEEAGYTFPKPLIDVNGKPMIQAIVNNLNIDAEYIFIVQQSHYEKYNLNSLLNLIAPNCKIVQVDGITEGAACTTLLAKKYIDNDEELLIANSDQIVEWDSNAFMYSMQNSDIDAGIVSFTATHPKWSFAKLNSDGLVERVAEKDPISDIATTGIYYWTKGSDYVKYAEQMIAKNIRVNNEFYVCPVFNEAIQDKKKVRIWHIDKMWGIGTPEDLKTYLDKNV